MQSPITHKRFLKQIVVTKNRKESDSKFISDQTEKDFAEVPPFENSPYKKREKRTTLPNINTLSFKLNKHIQLSPANMNNKHLSTETCSENNTIILGKKKLEPLSKFNSQNRRLSLMPSTNLNLTPNWKVKEVQDSPAIIHHKKHNSLALIDELSLETHDLNSFTILTASKTQPGISNGAVKVNQDSLLCKISGMDIKGLNLFGVMDGHGSHGHFISQSVKSLFTEFILDASHYDYTESLSSICTKFQDSEYSHLKQCFMFCETSLARSKYEINFSGTTAALVAQVGNTIFCANTGDSRAILFNKNNTIICLSKDHKPDDPSEKERIISSGGRVEKLVENGQSVGPFRVWLKYEDYPGLAMSRSLGDFVSKSIGCSYLPEIVEHKLTNLSKFLVIASDGVWEFLSNMKVCRLIDPFYAKRDPEGACSKIVEESTKMWKKEDEGQDDITCLIVFFYAS